MMFLHNREELQALRQKAEAELHRQKIYIKIQICIIGDFLKLCIFV